jgi:hypothetical protein
MYLPFCATQICLGRMAQNHNQLRQLLRLLSTVFLSLKNSFPFVLGWVQDLMKQNFFYYATVDPKLSLEL